MGRRQRWRRLGRLAGVPTGILQRANAELDDGLTPAGRDRDGYRIKVPDAYYDRISAVLTGASRQLVWTPYVQVGSAFTQSPRGDLP